MSSGTATFLRIMRHPLKYKLFLLFKLPSAFFSGVRVRAVTETFSEVTVPYMWITQNPFRSTYFASLAMAAELSTGVLAMAHLYKSETRVSMLVVKLEAQYFKKATRRTHFFCADGASFKEAIDRAVTTGEPQTVTATAAGSDASGTEIALFRFTWSFKVRKG